MCAVEVSPRRSAGTRIALANCHRRGIAALSRTLTLTPGARPRYVRVRDSAGNWTGWVRLASSSAIVH